MPEQSPVDLPPDLTKYMDVFVVRSPDGYVIWRRGTGDNAELLFIRSMVKGGGKRLVRLMLRQLLNDPPWEGKGTVYGFTRQGNLRAQEFYLRLGFDLSLVEGVYGEGSATVFSAPFNHLCQALGVT